MDVSALACAMSLASTGAQVETGVLKAIQNLSQNVAAELFASIGLGSQVDVSA